MFTALLLSALISASNGLQPVMFTQATYNSAEDPTCSGQPMASNGALLDGCINLQDGSSVIHTYVLDPKVSTLANITSTVYTGSDCSGSASVVYSKNQMLGNCIRINDDPTVPRYKLTFETNLHPWKSLGSGMTTLLSGQSDDCSNTQESGFYFNALHSCLGTVTYDSCEKLTYSLSTYTSGTNCQEKVNSYSGYPYFVCNDGGGTPTAGEFLSYLPYRTQVCN